MQSLLHALGVDAFAFPLRVESIALRLTPRSESCRQRNDAPQPCFLENTKRKSGATRSIFTTHGPALGENFSRRIRSGRPSKKPQRTLVGTCRCRRGSSRSARSATYLKTCCDIVTRTDRRNPWIPTSRSRRAAFGERADGVPTFQQQPDRVAQTAPRSDDVGMSTILLTGATGNVTSAVIRSLQGSGHRLIGLVRDPAKAKDLAAQGVQLRTGDLSLLRTVEGAFVGVDVAWLLTPPGPSAPFQASNALWAAWLGGVKHVVRMSAVGAAHDAPNLNSRLHALSDAEIAGCGLSFTVVKPHFFMQNLTMAAQSVAEQGTIYFALGDAKLPMVDVRDIGTSVAAILANPAPHAGKTYTLTGPTTVGMDQVASALSEALGKPVKYVPVPVAAMVETLTKMGLDDYNQVALRDYFTAYSRGWESQVTSAVKDLTGIEARGIAEFARDHAAAFGKR